MNLLKTWMEVPQGYQTVGQPTYVNGIPNGNGYLPPFLIGSTAQSKSPPNKFSSNYGHNRNTPILQQQRGLHGAAENSGHGLTLSHKAPMDKPGPPVEGLFDQIASPKSSTPLTTSSPARRQLNFSSFNTIGQGSPVISHTPAAKEGLNMSGVTNHHSQLTRFSSPAQIDPFYTQGDDLNSNDIFQQCWVTVYGFPPASASSILEQFAQYGTILKHVMCSNGNWMHILYQSKLQAKKALSKNGKIFGNGIMVGVQPCIDKSIIESSVGTSLTPAVANKSLGAMRPLTAAYHASQSQNEVVPTNPNTPQKDNGFIAKAMEYIFGW